ncbi:hypothetical protein SEA_PHOEBE_6 [Mycobacterium phage Phoebe]|uniref:Uncharacterized protein n=9 Tax=Microwolfvirus JHC117 TaxID=1034136 RepID=A0A0A7S2J6_9CAUD|nr:hypothetical protein FGG58_gp06 [Mycobacterium phage JHC117]AJA43396.1 hypothetical protein PBI_TAURUS_6 [Mycobacterium phage Taurus]ALY07720.1 hypothetical protein JENCASNA_6 [Mycobacterium phage JenCasNa]AMO43686.1 hypothetical protein PBI_MARIE_6 [Mycobacterium phage Marie]AMW63906.1 hypothetical protein SEA_HERCULES11_6 [Mycobacterium phage Hercules11]APC43327.1 hypothetical protein SEA_SABINATOR_6 [Mycobacterium phage Sabinator]AVE00202.1 hypothetical protein SEA_LUGYA_8 [Mycobacteriu
MQLPNPTNTEDYEFAFCFEVKGQSVFGNADPDTFYPNIQYGYRGADGEPPAAIIQAYLDNLWQADQDFLRISVLYVAPVTWTVIDPDDVGTLPGSIEDYSFGMMFDVVDNSVDPPSILEGYAMVGDGAYGAQYSQFLSFYEGMAAAPGSTVRNPRFVYAPKIAWSTWEFEA